MKRTLVFLCLLGVSWCVQLTPIVLPGEYENSVAFDNGNFNLYWKILEAESKIEIAVEAQTDGWLSIGFSEQGAGHANNDAIIVFVQNKGVATSKDYIVQGQTPGVCPGVCDDVDNGGSYDPLDLVGRDADGKTTIKYQRYMNTGDSNDVIIQNGVYAIWAYGDRDQIAAHDTQRRGYVQIDFLDGVVNGDPNQVIPPGGVGGGPDLSLIFIVVGAIVGVAVIGFIIFKVKKRGGFQGFGGCGGFGGLGGLRARFGRGGNNFGGGNFGGGNLGSTGGIGGQPMGNFGGPPMGNFGGPPMGNFGGPPMGNFGGPPMGNFNGPPMGNFGGPPMGGNAFGGPPMGNFGGPPPAYGRPPMGGNYGY